MAVLRISDRIFEVFPEVVVGVIRFNNINNAGENAEIMAALREQEAAAIARFAGVSINDHPHIAAWREAYRKFGAKPKDYPSSIENLLKRVVKGYSIPHINLMVDIYNSVSLRHVAPVGGEDLDKIDGDIELTFAAENEAPLKLLGEPEERPPKPGEVIYKDRISAICRRWNWKEADRTKFTPDTKNGFLVIEGLPPVDSKIVQHAIDELHDLVGRYCGGSLSKGILSASTAREFSLMN
jgi:DNA/RNA-binding domain of Phe-tRNA-synthetase-like protein